MLSKDPDEVAADRGELLERFAQEGRIVAFPARFTFRMSEEVRAGVVRDLGALGAVARPALPQLLRTLRSDPANRVRRAAATALVQIAPNDPQVEVALIRTLSDDKPTQLATAAALKQLGTVRPEHVPQVALVLGKTSSARLRHDLVAVLAASLEHSPRARNTLINIFRVDTDLTLRTRAAAGLHRSEPSILVDGQDPVQTCLDIASEQVESTHPMVKAEGIRALGILGPAAKSTIPELIEAAQHYSYSVQNAALIALSRMGPDAREAVPVMIALLQDENWLLIPPVAATALGNLGPVAKEAVPALQECLTAQHRGLRSAAADALKKIQGE
jgi:HEAT repeat protein